VSSCGAGSERHAGSGTARRRATQTQAATHLWQSVITSVSVTPVGGYRVAAVVSGTAQYAAKHGVATFV